MAEFDYDAIAVWERARQAFLLLLRCNATDCRY